MSMNTTSPYSSLQVGIFIVGIIIGVRLGWWAINAGIQYWF